MRKILGLSWAASCYYVCFRASSSCTDRSCQKVPGSDIAIASPANSFISAPSVVLTIFHLSHLSYCCLDWPCPFVGYQHLIFSAWPLPHDACGQRLLPFDLLLQPTIECYNSTFETFDPLPLPSLIPISFRPQPGLSHTLDSRLVDSHLSPTASLRRCAMTSVPIHTDHTNSLPRPRHTTTTFVRPAFRTE